MIHQRTHQITGLVALFTGVVLVSAGCASGSAEKSDTTAEQSITSDSEVDRAEPEEFEWHFEPERRYGQHCAEIVDEYVVPSEQRITIDSRTRWVLDADGNKLREYTDHRGDGEFDPVKIRTVSAAGEDENWAEDHEADGHIDDIYDVEELSGSRFGFKEMDRDYDRDVTVEVATVFRRDEAEQILAEFEFRATEPDIELPSLQRLYDDIELDAAERVWVVAERDGIELGTVSLNAYTDAGDTAANIRWKSDDERRIPTAKRVLDGLGLDMPHVRGKSITLETESGIEEHVDDLFYHRYDDTGRHLSRTWYNKTGNGKLTVYQRSDVLDTDEQGRPTIRVYDAMVADGIANYWREITYEEGRRLVKKYQVHISRDLAHEQIPAKYVSVPHNHVVEEPVDPDLILKTRTEIRLDEFGNELAERETRSLNALTYTYDEDGQLIEEVSDGRLDPKVYDGRPDKRIRYEYDPQGRRTGKTTIDYDYRLNPFHQRKSDVREKRTERRFEYGDGRLVREVVTRNVGENYERDTIYTHSYEAGMRVLTKVASGDGEVHEQRIYRYDDAGRLIEERRVHPSTGRGNHVRRFEHGSRGQKTAETRYNIGHRHPYFRIEYTYDEDGRRIRATEFGSEHGRESSPDLAPSFFTEFEYDENGRLTREVQKETTVTYRTYACHRR